MITLPQESRLARLRRLQVEIAELESETSNEQTSALANAPPARPSVLPPRSKVDVVGQLSHLRTRLTLVSESTDGGTPSPPQRPDADWPERLRRLEAVPPVSTSSPAPVEDDAHPSIGEVDRRLASLEELVGVAAAADETVS